jgi:hypothetical protein
MARALTFVGILLFFSLSGTVYYFWSRYQNIYDDVLTKVDLPPYFSVKNRSEKILNSPEVLSFDKVNEDQFIGWRKFHLKDFVTSVPLYDSNFRLSLILEYRGKGVEPLVGFRAEDSFGQKIWSLHFLPPFYFQKHLKTQKLFEVPYVQERLVRISKRNIWNDLFSKNLMLATNRIDEKLYNLYILHLRNSFLLSNHDEFGFVNKKPSLKYISFKNDQETEHSKIFYRMSDDGKVYSFLFRRLLDSSLGKAVEKKVLSEIDFRPRDSVLASLIYNEYRALSSRERYGQVGLFYLLSAWTQSGYDQAFIREAVNILEKHSGNLDVLDLFYSFSRKFYGFDFLRKKTGSIKKQKSVKKKKELSEEEKEEQFIKGLSPKERMKYLLEKSKNIEKPKANQERKIIVD